MKADRPAPGRGCDPPSAQGNTQPENPRPAEESKAPALALDALPEVFREAIEAVERESGCPGELALPFMLANVAGGLQRSFCLDLRTGRVELTIYALAVAPTTRGKGAGHQLSRGTLAEIEAAYTEACRAEVARWESEGRTLRLELEAVEAQLAKQRAGRVRTKEGEEARVVTEEERDALARRLAAHQDGRPRSGRIYTSNPTPERTATLLYEAGETFMVVTSEAKEVLHAGTGYSSSSIERIDLFLGAFAGEPFSVDRANGTRALLRRPRLTMALAIQPDSVPPWVAQYGGRGYPQRFLYVVGGREPGSRRLAECKPIPRRVRARLEAVAARAWGLEVDTEKGGFKPPVLTETDPKGIRFEEDAEDALVAWHDNEIQPRLRVGGSCHEPEHFRNWMERLFILGAKLAGIFHAVEVEDFAEKAIPLERALRAIRFAESLIEHARIVFDAPSPRRSEKGDDADAVHHWLERKGDQAGEGGWVTVREVRRQHSRRFREVAQAEAAVRELVQRGVLRSRSTDHTTKFRLISLPDGLTPDKEPKSKAGQGVDSADRAPASLPAVSQPGARDRQSDRRASARAERTESGHSDASRPFASGVRLSGERASVAASGGEP